MEIYILYTVYKLLKIISILIRVTTPDGQNNHVYIVSIRDIKIDKSIVRLLARERTIICISISSFCNPVIIAPYYRIQACSH